MDERPPPDPLKLLEQWRAWGRGEVLPGRTMSDLKMGGLPDLLESLPEPPADLVETWTRWERGTVDPAAVLQSLADAGLSGLLERLAEERQGAS